MAAETAPDSPPARRAAAPPAPETHARAAAPISGSHAPAALILCVRCHGTDGISPSDLWPNLAGQNAAYLRQQLIAFRDGTRRDALMSSWAKKLQSDDIEALAHYYSELPAARHAQAARPAAAVPRAAAGDTDHVVPAWYLGMPVVLRGQQLHPPGSLDEARLRKLPGPRTTVYVTAPVRPGIGASPAREVPLGGRSVFLPAHQATLSALNAPDAARLGIGYFVQRGPKGTTETVRVQPQPEHSWPSAPLASAIRIGAEWVGLDSHVVIEYGLATGLLALEFFDASDAIWATTDWEDYAHRPELATACACGAPPHRNPSRAVPPPGATPPARVLPSVTPPSGTTALADGATPPSSAVSPPSATRPPRNLPGAAQVTAREPDHSVPAWYLGMPVMVRAYEVLTLERRLAGELPADVPVATSYITAPVTETSAFSPERRIRLPRGEVTLPAHQATLTTMSSPAAPEMSVAHFVIPGPAASPERVRAAARPADGWASAPLVREIRIGAEWVKLNNHHAIEYGLALGLLALEYFDGGAYMWATADWERFEHRPELAIECAPAREAAP